MMNLSPLQLEHYFITECHCDARIEPPDENDRVYGQGPATAEQFSTEVQMLQSESESDVYQIALTIKSQNDQSPAPLYQLRLHVVGFFRISKDFSHEHLEHLVQTNGASVLYSAARDFTLTLTARGPWGPLLLPTINFRIGKRA